MRNWLSKGAPLGAALGDDRGHDDEDLEVGAGVREEEDHTGGGGGAGRGGQGRRGQGGGGNQDVFQVRAHLDYVICMTIWSLFFKKKG